ncbi:MAG: hypothetical protein KatS3mg076_0562 [Candidatus Binatia bacterium]|nr:MAG: hypothetical protein KatS3mg076_0562 [Candidatus Binatia bacterium]
MPGSSTELPIVTKLKKELAELQEELTKKLPKELEAARAHGDLSENAEYEACKERQGFLTARIAQLQARIRQLSLYNTSSVPRDVVGYGSFVTVEDVDTGAQATYEIVFPEEVDAGAGKISLQSPLGKALLHRSEGDEVTVQTPRGKKVYQILRVLTLHDRTE